jgi:hypothetical protein
MPVTAFIADDRLIQEVAAAEQDMGPLLETQVGAQHATAACLVLSGSSKLACDAQSACVG